MSASAEGDAVPPRISEDSGAIATSRPVLKTNSLSKSFGRVRAVDRLSITVREGQIYGFLGRNGAGKTTTIRMLMGIISSDDGSIELFGDTITRPNVKHKQRIGYVSQEQHFYPWMSCKSIGQFVGKLYPTWDQVEFDRLLQVFDLPPKRRISALSHGMSVKLALALALAHRPPLLILDEPTAGLDPVARREFLEIIQRQARKHNRTTFFSSHIIDEVERIADQIGIMHDGKLRFEGDIATLRDSVRRVTWRRGSASGVNGEAVPGAALSPPPPPPVPAGFEILKHERNGEPNSVVLMSSPANWESPPLPFASVERLSLEDCFIALSGGDIAQV